MQITSDGIESNSPIPQQYTCEGENNSPPLAFWGVPAGTQNLVLIMEDPDTPGEASTHWMLYNMLPATLEIRENLPPPTGKTGTNDFGHAGYDGPCPPSGTHRYVWRLYALTSMLNIPEGVSRRGLQEAMEGYITDTAELVGWYTKSAETSR